MRVCMNVCIQVSMCPLCLSLPHTHLFLKIRSSKDHSLECLVYAGWSHGASCSRMRLLEHQNTDKHSTRMILQRQKTSVLNCCTIITGSTGATIVFTNTCVLVILCPPSCMCVYSFLQQERVCKSETHRWQEFGSFL